MASGAIGILMIDIYFNGPLVDAEPMEIVMDLIWDGQRVVDNWNTVISETVTAELLEAYPLTQDRGKAFPVASNYL